MRRDVRFWFVSFSVFHANGPLSSRPFSVTEFAIELVSPITVRLLLQEAGYKLLLAQALSHSAQQKALETDFPSPGQGSSNESHIRSVQGCTVNGFFRGNAADFACGDIPDVNKTRIGNKNAGSISSMFLRPLASSSSTKLSPAAERAIAPRWSNVSAQRCLAPCKYLRRLHRLLLARETRVKKAEQTRPQVHLRLQPQTPSERVAISTYHQNPPLTFASATAAPPEDLIELLEVDEVACQRAQQAIVAVDGGSSKTQPSLFSVLTESCAEGKHAGRHVLPDTLNFVGDGGKYIGVRQLVERWLQRLDTQEPEAPKQPSAVSDYQKKLLQHGFPLLEQATQELVSKILRNMVQLIETSMSELEQQEARSLGIPVIFHSTAGLRDLPNWYREGLFIALRRAINSAPPIDGFVFFTNQEFSRPISGHFEAICAFLSANYLLGNLTELREHLQVQVQRAAQHLSIETRHRSADRPRRLRRDVIADGLTPVSTEETKARESLGSPFAGASQASENTDSSSSELPCADDCFARSPDTGKISATRCRSGKLDIRFCAHEYLAAIVESGGASMQIAFPIRRLDLLPPNTRIYNLQKSGFLSEDYPPTDVVAISFMQLGSNSAGGLFLKLLCATGSPFMSEAKVCTNPCFHENYSQPCSAGEVVISDTGEVSVREEALHNRLRPAAVFCGEDNAQVFVKTSTEVECRASNFDPITPLQRRLEIPNCKSIVGSGSFDKCVEAVNHFLIQPQFPLPANQEALAAGFENPSQVFNFFSSRAPLLITGNSFVLPMRTLQTTGFLPPGDLLFTGADLGRIVQASKSYCGTPLVRDSKGALRLARNGRVRRSDLNINNPSQVQTLVETRGKVPTVEAVGNDAYAVTWEDIVTPGQGGAGMERGGTEHGLKIDPLNYENCQRLATAVALLRSIYEGAERPSHILFTNELQAAPAGAEGRDWQGKRRPMPGAKLGWQTGAILRHISNETAWRKSVYELGAAHSLHWRMRRQNKEGAHDKVAVEDRLQAQKQRGD